MVMGAWPMENSLTVCGTLSSRTRKMGRGRLGMKLLLLSITATSTVTRLASDEKVAEPGPASAPVFGRGASLEGIFGRFSEGPGWAGVGVAVVGAGVGVAVGVSLTAGRRGRATVSLPTEPGPSCANNTA